MYNSIVRQTPSKAKNYPDISLRLVVKYYKVDKVYTGSSILSTLQVRSTEYRYKVHPRSQSRVLISKAEAKSINNKFTIFENEMPK